jgi:hypothetical protein
MHDNQGRLKLLLYSHADNSLMGGKNSDIDWLLTEYEKCLTIINILAEYYEWHKGAFPLLLKKSSLSSL